MIITTASLVIALFTMSAFTSKCNNDVSSFLNHTHSTKDTHDTTRVSPKSSNQNDIIHTNNIICKNNREKKINRCFSFFALAMSTIDNLSVGQLKKALKSLNIDDSHCVEKADLQQTLRQAEADGRDVAGAITSQDASTAPSHHQPSVDFSSAERMTLKCHAGGGTVTYEDQPLLVGNSRDPTTLVTLVHGLGDSANGWRQTAKQLSHQLPHVLFMLPTAPRQPVTVNGGMAMNAWFDILQLGGAHMTAEQMAARPSDANGVLTSAKYVSYMAGHVAQKYKIPTNRIIFGGFSQGAAISIAAGLTAPYVPLAVMPLSGFFPASKEVIAAATQQGQVELLIKHKVPFQFFHGDSDQVLPLPLARMSVEALRGVGIPHVDLKVYRNMGHSTSTEEIYEVIAWLKSVTEQSKMGVSYA